MSTGALLAAAGCTAPPPVAPDAAGARIAAPDEPGAAPGPHAHAVDGARSMVRILVFRAGRAARLGHNHVLIAPAQGWVDLPDEVLAHASFELAFSLGALVVDDREERAGLGPAFESPVSAAAIEGTREHMLGAAGLDAARTPTLRVQGLEIAGEPPLVAAHLRILLHGRSQDTWVPIEVRGWPERPEATGRLVLRQSDFGITPYSVGGGLLSIRDEVVVEVRIALVDGPPDRRP